MDPFTTVSAAIAVGKPIADKAIGYVSELGAVMEEAKDRGINSLSQYTKKTFISSRVYIEDIISGEKTVADLMQLLNKMYAAMVLTALNLNNIVQGSKTVSQYLSPVSTEVFQNIVDMIRDEFGDVEVKAVESNDQKDKAGVSGSLGNKEVKIETDPSKLFTGRLMSVTLGDKNNRVEIYFLVQLCPYIIPSLVMEQFLSTNTDPSKTIRTAQWKSGEIRFWKDFIFECDRVEKRKKALRLDKDGILREIEDHKQGGLWKSILNFFKPKTEVKRNVANTIIVISKRTLDKICRELGLNMKNFKDRQNIMANTLSLMIVAYDPNYQTVDLYMNGIANRGEYNAQMISGATKKDDNVDIKQLLTLMAAGSAPKF